MQPLHDLEGITKSKTFPLSIEIAATTRSVDEKSFFYQVPSTETIASAVSSGPRCLAAASTYFSPPLVSMQPLSNKIGHHMYFWSLVVACSKATKLSKKFMNNPDTSETVYSPNVDLHIFHSSASIVFGAVNLG